MKKSNAKNRSSVHKIQVTLTEEEHSEFQAGYAAWTPVDAGSRKLKSE